LHGARIYGNALSPPSYTIRWDGTAVLRRRMKPWEPLPDTVSPVSTMRQPKARTIAFLVAASISLVDHNDSARAQAQPCRSREYAHNAYTVCEVDLGKHTVRVYWKRSDGTPYAYLSSLPRVLEHETGRLLFATNAGMFDPALKPVGLYVEQGRELVHVNTKSGYGNFHMKPNGICRRSMQT
jgi:uncharacterized protein YigE (DUF2233 family)